MKIRSNQIVEVNAEKAWEVVGEQFGEFGGWACNLLETHLEGELEKGGVRICQTAGFGPFSPNEFWEELIDFDPKELTYTYKATIGLPSMFTSAQNRWQVTPLGKKRSEVSFCATMLLKWWARPMALILPSLMAQGFQQFREEMKYKIETGNPHPRKTEIQTKAGYVSA